MTAPAGFIRDGNEYVASFAACAADPWSDRYWQGTQPRRMPVPDRLDRGDGESLQAWADRLLQARRMGERV